ncbi:MAG: BTAD domain-containing putative transcriptional regulator [Gaiellaceae bacterium]
MEYRVLGSLEVLDGSGRALPLGGARQQTVLGSLLLRAGRTVPLELLVDELWEKPPETAAKTVQVYVSRLRRLLAPGAIESRSGGYALLLDGDRLDLTQFERLADEGRDALSAADCERAASLLREALALWRGPALGGLPAEALRREAESLEEARLQTLEDRVEADLGRGREREVVGELRALVAEHPFRERLCGQLMRALYAAGRQAEALEVYREARTLLDEELGLEPGAELRDLERRMLSHDPELEHATETQQRAAPPRLEAAAPIRARRPATVVFADVVDSTAMGEQLDPESVHRILERYSETATTILERHGGTVEKFIGDAIVGFFGLTEVHEDDAQRAVRAAVELREAVSKLTDELRRDNGIELGMKIGVNSGDVFVGAGARREMFATGDSVNVAARLEQHACEGEILLGERTFRLVEEMVDAEPLEPLAVKGRKALVSAWRLLELSPAELLSHRHQVPFVGRERQLDELRSAFARTRDARECALCTIVGPAGMGKSRLAEEFVGELQGSATVAVGRCLSYGEAITYHALAEILQELVGDDPDSRIAEVVGGEDAALVARRVRATMGLVQDTAPAEETFWAVRRLFEAAADERPLVAILDDLHWGEPLLLDLLEYLAGFSTGAPILILCLARDDLFETRPSWAAGEVVMLDALAEPEARELVHAIGDGEVDPPEEARIVRTAEGNPLFLEQLVATRTECGAKHLPPNVQAVLTARVASLDHGERTVLEHASVEGRNFRWSVVAELLPEEARESLGRDLMALVRRHLIEPDPSVFAGEDGFRFSHVLIREAVYEGLPKEVCADLHERLARRLRDGPGSEDEVVGHHLEQAFRARSQLGLVGERDWELAREAQARLHAAAHKVLVVGDPDAAADLLARAVSLLPADDPSRVSLLPTLGTALLEAGRFSEADGALTEAIDRAGGDDLLEARARLEQQFVRLQAEGAIDDPERIAQEALRVFEAHGDIRGQSRTWCLRATVDWIQGQAERADEGWQRAADLARLAEDELELFEILAWRASAAPIGPTPVPDAIATCAEIREEVGGSPLATAQMLPPFASLYAMQGDFETARLLVREANTLLGELGRIYTVALAHHDATVELLAGQPAAAEERLRTAYERFDELGEKALFASTASMLAQAVYEQGRYEEATLLCAASETAAAADDLSAQVEWRSVAAKLLARRGRAAEAEELAREAVELVARTDFLRSHGDALLDLGEVLALSEEPEQAAAAVGAGLELYKEKGDTVMAGRARSRLDATGLA